MTLVLIQALILVLVLGPILVLLLALILISVPGPILALFPVLSRVPVSILSRSPSWLLPVTLSPSLLRPA